MNTEQLHTARIQHFAEWLRPAVANISELDDVDAEYGFATPDEAGADEILLVAMEASNAACALIERGEIEQGKGVAREAIVYAMRGATRLTPHELRDLWSRTKEAN
jgi:hypothetical protein